MGSFTAKVKVTNHVRQHNGEHSLSFAVDYADGRNKEWAVATPALSVSMTVKDGVADDVEVGDLFTLTFVNDTAQPAQSDAATSDDPDVDEVPPNAGSAV
jgi:hypothetical protein